MTIEPIGERVLIKPKIEADKTKGGIYIPESAKEEKKEGTVIAVGTYKDGSDLPVKKGDTVIYGGYSNEEFEVDGEKHVFVELKNIVGKVK